MNARRGMACLLVLLPVAIVAKDPAPVFRVTRVEITQEGRLDDVLLHGCDVARIVTEAMQRYSPRHSKKAATTTELVLRIDRVARVAAGSGGKWGSTDLGITLISAGARAANQPFFCREPVHDLFTNPTQCGRSSDTQNQSTE